MREPSRALERGAAAPLARVLAGPRSSFARRDPGVVAEASVDGGCARRRTPSRSRSCAGWGSRSPRRARTVTSRSRPRWQSTSSSRSPSDRTTCAAVVGEMTVRFALGAAIGSPSAAQERERDRMRRRAQRRSTRPRPRHDVAGAAPRGTTSVSGPGQNARARRAARRSSGVASDRASPRPATWTISGWAAAAPSPRRCSRRAPVRARARRGRRRSRSGTRRAPRPAGRHRLVERGRPVRVGGARSTVSTRARRTHAARQPLNVVHARELLDVLRATFQARWTTHESDRFSRAASSLISSSIDSGK